MHEVTTRQAFAFVFEMVRSFRSGLVAMVCVATVWAVEVSLSPYLLKVIINRLIEYPSHSIVEYLAFPA